MDWEKSIKTSSIFINSKNEKDIENIIKNQIKTFKDNFINIDKNIKDYIKERVGKRKYF